ncbi:MAG: calcium/sodium antiporter, partial [Rhodospirillaceae bacterium]
MIYIHLIAGLVLLLGGGELLVRGAVRLAAAIGLSPLVIGLTVVGFGTSTPELVTSIEAALSGTPGIAIGNIVGSNIANILLILGIAAMIFPIAVSSGALRRDGMVMLGAAVLFAVLSALMPLGRLLGAGFAVMLLAYVFIIVRIELRATARHGAVFDKALALEAADPGLSPGMNAKGGLLFAAGFCIAGLALLIFGGGLLVDGAVSLASQMGVSDTIIGLTIVAVGTSLPELITSVIAALRKQADVAFG